mmetsp:Transcript_7390/g.10857  ORF Transcript_7390/g.10857 Transcript_7390/m.10857 type:complete len:116 (-) Transcript_7390:1531-1878(-)
MMKAAFLFFMMLVASVACFSPSHFGLPRTTDKTVCFAKHVKDKAAKWARAKRPKKTRPSDINRKKKVYDFESMEKPPEWVACTEEEEKELQSWIPISEPEDNIVIKRRPDWDDED